MAAHPDTIRARLDEMRAWETGRRAATDFASLPSSTRTTGPNPYAVRPLPGTGRWVGILRGRDAVVVLGPNLEEIQRLPAPPSPTGLAVEGGPSAGPASRGATRVYVGGELSPRVGIYRVTADGRLADAGEVMIPGLTTVRDLTVTGERTLCLADVWEGRLTAVRLRDSRGGIAVADRRDLDAGPGVFRVRRAAGHLVTVSLFDHSARVFPLDAAGLPIEDGVVRVAHDGPIWCADAASMGAAGGGLLLALGGVEDRPLDRSAGFFGHVDSYLYLYRVTAAPPRAERLAAVNVSAAGVITPKWLSLGVEGSDVAVLVTGYGGEAAAVVRWRAGTEADPEIVAHPLPPGTSDAARGERTRGDAASGDRAAWRTADPNAFGIVAADPLLDAWVRVGGGEVTAVSVPDEPAPGLAPRSRESKLGEVLFFTTLMGPAGVSDGPQSRFSCETCHFEGGVDGRTHFTGRGEVHATTKPLFGLFNNRPHFSRALDPDLTTMVHNEFRVAGRATGLDPWFTLDPARRPWLARHLGSDHSLPPETLRRSLAAFLMEFTHPPNPAARGRSRFTDIERRGAAAFRERCESCHAARLIADDPATRVAFEDWERLILSEAGPVVWASDGYRKTGVKPYVHEEGARTPSLRRIGRKRPYFTNGSAPDLEAVLERARWRESGFAHAESDTAPGDSPPGAVHRLDAATRAALLAFLRLL
jgi:hypothetical protein